MTTKQVRAFRTIARSTFRELFRARKIPTVWTTRHRPRLFESDLIAVVLLIRKGGRRNDV